jgi:CheY-like chemotaxis protein
MPAAPPILVIEDDPALRKLLETALQKSGYPVMCAEHGLDALLKIEGAAVKPGLLIVDIMMPELDGLTLVRALKAQGGTKKIPVIFITAKADPKTIAEGISLGARYYLTKPFMIDDLIGKVRKALA